MMTLSIDSRIASIWIIVTMTNWLPSLKEGSGPLYVRLADQIEADIAAGILPSGAKLPPQRDLAYDIKVTIGTIGRAYALVRERGLVSGEVGRGTYVLPQQEEPANDGRDRIVSAFSGTRLPVPPDGKLRFDTTAAPDVGQSGPIETFLTRTVRDYRDEISSYTRIIPDRWKEAGRKWLSNATWQPTLDCIVPVLGAHAGIMSVIHAISQPGDYIAFEELTYAQVSRAAAMTGRRIVTVASDEGGILPDDLERVCAQKHPKAIFLMPSAQNPTAATLSVERRRAIAEIARTHNVWLIEDNLYGAMAEDGLPFLAELAPDKTFHIGGLSKSVAAGVRGGWVACPPHFAARVNITHKLSTGGIPFVLFELCASLVLSGTASTIRRQVLAECRAREEMVEAIFGDLDISQQRGAPFFWLRLPEPWHAGTYKQAAFDRGILIDDEDEFKPARSDRVHHAVRISYSSPRDRKDVENGLKTLKALIDAGQTGYDTDA
jgi:DNA-binding transcriptional MocR family regulator